MWPMRRGASALCTRASPLIVVAVMMVLARLAPLPVLEQEPERHFVEFVGHERRYAVRAALERDEARTRDEPGHFARILRPRRVVRRADRDQRRRRDPRQKLRGVVRHRRANLRAGTRLVL